MNAGNFLKIETIDELLEKSLRALREPACVEPARRADVAGPSAASAVPATFIGRIFGSGEKMGKPKKKYVPLVLPLLDEVNARVDKVRAYVETRMPNASTTPKAESGTNERNTVSVVEEGLSEVRRQIFALQENVSAFLVHPAVASASIADGSPVAYARLRTAGLANEIGSLVFDFEKEFGVFFSEKSKLESARVAVFQLKAQVNQLTELILSDRFALRNFQRSGADVANAEVLLKSIGMSAKQCLSMSAEEFVPTSALAEAHAAWLSRALGSIDGDFLALAEDLLTNPVDAGKVFERSRPLKELALAAKYDLAAKAPEGLQRREEYLVWKPKREVADSPALSAAFEMLYAMRRLRAALTELDLEKIKRAVEHSRQARRASTHIRESA